jgi:outer membrane protein TolC
MEIQRFAQQLFSARQTRHPHDPHPVTKKSGVAHMKSISSVAASQEMSLTIGTGPNANSKRSLFSHETGIVFNSGLPRLRKLKLTFGLWRRREGETNDDADDFSNRDWRSRRSGRCRVHKPIAQKQGADPTWRGQKAPPVGVRELKEERVGYAVRVLFGNVPRLLFGAIFVAVVIPCVLTSVAAQNTAVTGSVPSGAASNEVTRLTLQDAIKMALRYNLGAIESGENVQFTRGQRLIALSSLLPQVSAGVSENVGQTSLATFGFKLPGVPTVIGPYSYSTVDASLSQTLFSFESVQRFRAARTAEQAAQLSYQDILDVVTLTVGNAYLQVIETNSRIEAQQAQVRNAQALYEQALSEYQAGTSPRIDATRTEVQLHTEEYNLSVACNNFAIAKLTLSRAIGLPLGQVFDIADQLPYNEINPPTVEDALKTAYSSRSDFRAALDSEKAAQQTLSAEKGERYPIVAVNGDYGDVGATFGHSNGNFNFQAGVRVPIFTGGRIKGDITQAEASVRQRKAEAENTRGQVNYDVRTAFLNVNADKEQVDVAKKNVALANENLERSKDRFASGVTDSVEVVQSEQSLASANDQYITSVYNHNLAKLMLARALGVARTSYKLYIGGN